MNDDKLRLEITVRLTNSAYGGPGPGVELKETVILDALDFLEAAKVLGNFHDLAQSVKKAKE